jgi:hypothetical protein
LVASVALTANIQSATSVGPVVAAYPECNLWEQRMMTNYQVGDMNTDVGTRRTRAAAPTVGQPAEPEPGRPAAVN